MNLWITENKNQQEKSIFDKNIKTTGKKSDIQVGIVLQSRKGLIRHIFLRIRIRTVFNFHRL